MSSPTAAGKSSFDLVDSGRLFAKLQQLGLGRGVRFLDLACGAGNYLLALAPLLGEEDEAVGVDLWREGVERLRSEAAARDLAGVKAKVADVSREIPLADQSVDICLMATVLHDLMADGVDAPAMKELVRVLKPGATLVVVEFRKDVLPPPGPPEHARIDPESLAQYCGSLGLEPLEQPGLLDLGPQLYGMLFRRG